MRVGIFTDTYEPFLSGVVTSIKILKNDLEKKGHEVYVVTANLENMHYIYDEENKILKIPGIRLKALYDVRLTGIYPLKALKQIKKWDLDVVHIQSEFGIGIFGRIFAKQFQIPLIYTYHTMYEEYVHYITGSFFDAPGKKIAGYLTKIVCDKAVRSIITPSKKSRDLLKEKYKVETEVNIIPNGIEIERFYKENFSKTVIEAYKKDLGIKEEEFVLFFLGRVGKEKNISFLITGFKELLKKDKKYKMVIVGDGPAKKKLEKQVKKLKLEDYVIFTGKVSQDVVPFYYQLGDLFVTASKTETQGMTIIEAQAASLPVLCIEDDSYKQMLTDDVNGKYFKTMNEYVTLVENISKNPKTLKKYAANGKKSVEPYSSNHFGNKVLEVYKKAIKETPKERFPLLKKIINKLKKRG